MILTAQERFFIEKRRRLTRVWPVVSTLLLLAILSLAGWLFWSNPLLVNPWAVFSRLQLHSISESTLFLMAFLLPVAMLLPLLLPAPLTGPLVEGPTGGCEPIWILRSGPAVCTEGMRGLGPTARFN